MDYLKLHTGKSFGLPFEAMVIFSTNLEPADLMDAAFLRRIPYKFEIPGPSLEAFGRIFQTVAAANAMPLSNEVLDYIVEQITDTWSMPLAAYQPRFLIDQIVAACRFRDLAPRFERRFIDYALSNLTARRPSTRRVTLARVS